MAAGLSVAGLTRSDPPCAYVLSETGSDTVATPAVVLFTSPDSSTSELTCEHLGVSTPAVALHLSPSAFEAPGALVETPTIALELPNHIYSAPGHILSLREGTLVLPALPLQDTAPLGPVAEPRLFIDVRGEPRTARFLTLTGDPNKSARINTQEKGRPGSPCTTGAPTAVGRNT